MIFLFWGCVEMKSRNLWLLVGGLAVLSLLVLTAMFGIVPTVIEIQNVDQNRQQSVRENQAQSLLLEQLKTTAVNREALVESVKKLDVLLPSELNLVEFVRQLDETQTETGVSVSDLKISPPQVYVAPAAVSSEPSYLQALASVPEGDLFVSEFSLSISGKLSAISSYLERLRNGDRLILVSNLVFSESDTASNQSLTVDISAEVFAMRKPN